MNEVRVLLNEIESIISKNQSAYEGVYVMLQKHSNAYVSGGQSRMAVSYLLTDGQQGNGLTPSCAVKLPPIFDEAGSAIMLTTFGGRDEVTDEETLQQMASYYHLTRDRLITKFDIKQFCYKELRGVYQIPKEMVLDITFQPDICEGQQKMVVSISLAQPQNLEIPEDFAQRVSTELQQKINLRTTGFCEFEVNVRL